MELEDQVCCLKLSKKLKKLGIKQQSIYLWRNIFNKLGEKETDSYELYHPIIGYTWSLESNKYSAFTVSELLDMLVRGCFFNSTNELNLIIEKKEDFYYLKCKQCPYDIRELTKDKNLANSLAKLIIFLKS